MVAWLLDLEHPNERPARHHRVAVDSKDPSGNVMAGTLNLFVCPR
jgi:hypothetical protein